MLIPIALILVFASLPLAEAAVYSGYDETGIVLFWIKVQSWELWVKIDTSTHRWTITWKTNGVWPNSPWMYAAGQPQSYIHAWDDMGFSWSWGPNVLPAHPLSGEAKLPYYNIYTWTHTEIRWAYSTYPFYYDFRTLRVDIYVGH